MFSLYFLSAELVSPSAAPSQPDASDMSLSITKSRSPAFVFLVSFLAGALK